MIFRFVSILHDLPFSILVMVKGDILAFLESSVLLIIRDCLISLKEFFSRFLTIVTVLFNLIPLLHY
jgi:hypothetical protein